MTSAPVQHLPAGTPEEDPHAGPVVDAAGRLLGGVFGGLAALRGRKPLHPRGGVSPARLVRTGSGGDWGVPWLDEPGTDEAVVRVSRSVGLPSRLPDVLGLAVRVAGGDLLLASSSPRPVLRHVFVPAVHPDRAFYSSAFTYVTPRGNVVLGARPRSSEEYDVLVATVTGPWERFGTLTLLGPAEGDGHVDFDAARNPLPGLPLHPALAALRAPSYRQARAHRPG